MTTTDETDDKPLDPAAERLRRKLVRLLAFSMGFLILSIVTVFGVIIYRTMGSSPPVYDGSPSAIVLPANGEVVDTILDGDRILLTVRLEQETHLILVSAGSGEVLREWTLGTGGALSPLSGEAAGGSAN